jgi:hypothetical protein
MEDVSLEELPVRAPGAWYEELEPAVPWPAPPDGWSWPTAVRSGQAEARRRPSRGSGVLEVPGGVVFGRRGSVGSDLRGVLVGASALHLEDASSLQRWAEGNVATGIVDLDGSTMTLWAGPPNHSHCMLQAIPRLALLRRRFALEADRYLLTASPARAVSEAVARLGIPSDRIVTVPTPAPAFRCEVLRYATAPYLPNDAGVAWAVDFLRELFLPEPPAANGRRLYVGRPPGAQRRLLNETEVLALLEPAGFEHVLMEDLTVAEQATLFASAGAIVAPHGAALANAVFCRSGTTVIDLIGRNTIGNVFPHLAWRRRLDFELLAGTEPSPPPRWWTWQIDADTRADVEALRRSLATRDLL